MNLRDRKNNTSYDRSITNKDACINVISKVTSIIDNHRKIKFCDKGSKCEKFSTFLRNFNKNDKKYSDKEVEAGQFSGMGASSYYLFKGASAYTNKTISPY